MLVFLLGVLVSYLCMTRILFRYVRADFLPLLVLTGALLVFFGLWELIDGPDCVGPHHRDPDGSHAHDHSRVPRVAALLLVPLLLFSLCRPPALGAFSVESTVVHRSTSKSTDYDPYPGLPTERPSAMTLERFNRIFLDDPTMLNGKPVRLLGFAGAVADHPDQPTLNRLKIVCCAADALPFTVRLVDAPVVTNDAWYEVEGHLDLAASTDVLPAFVVTSVTPVPEPEDPYL